MPGFNSTNLSRGQNAMALFTIALLTSAYALAAPGGLNPPNRHHRDLPFSRPAP
jgi:hypothetical protein